MKIEVMERTEILVNSAASLTVKSTAKKANNLSEFRFCNFRTQIVAVFIFYIRKLSYNLDMFASQASYKISDNSNKHSNFPNNCCVNQ